MFLIEIEIRKFMVTIGEKAPNIKLGKWVQGMETNFDKEGDNVKLVEVFQVNCPGCFMYSMPEVINIYQKFKGDGLSVFGVATAFEDYDKNTLENLELLLTTGEVVGDTKQALSQYGQLKDGKLPYPVPNPRIVDEYALWVILSRIGAYGSLFGAQDVTQGYIEQKHEEFFNPIVIHYTTKGEQIMAEEDERFSNLRRDVDEVSEDIDPYHVL